MPGITSVELLDKGDDYVTIKTNGGIMKRSNISVKTEATSTTLEFNEEYQAGKKVTTNAHFRFEFTKNDNNLSNQLVISDLSAPGFLGFF